MEREMERVKEREGEGEGERYRKGGRKWGKGLRERGKE